MRDMKASLIYLAVAASIVLSILASGNWALSEYHSLFPTEAETHTTAVASKAELAGEAIDASDSLRQPVWIEPTQKYVYNPAQAVTVKPNPAPPVTMPKGHGKIAAKPARQRVAVSGEARRAYGSSGQAQQLLILPLQHQAPN